jgi:uncharacterized membrane protein
MDQPTEDQPTTNQPTPDQPAPDQPAQNQPAQNQPAQNQPATDQPNAVPLSCPDCAARMPGTAAFCPGCGRSMASTTIRATPATSRAQGKVGFLFENIAGALAYVTFIPAVVFLNLEPYKKNRFVRFHCVQCLLLWATGVLTALLLKAATLLLFIVPVVGPLFVVLVSVVMGLAAIVVWLVLVVKALQGETFKLPVLGDFAERQADSF